MEKDSRENPDGEEGDLNAYSRADFEPALVVKGVWGQQTTNSKQSRRR